MQTYNYNTTNEQGEVKTVATIVLSQVAAMKLGNAENVIVRTMAPRGLDLPLDKDAFKGLVDAFKAFKPEAVFVYGFTDPEADDAETVFGAIDLSRVVAVKTMDNELLVQTTAPQGTLFPLNPVVRDAMLAQLASLA